MSVELLTEHHLEVLSLTGGCTGSAECPLVKMPHCLKSRVAAHIFLFPNQNKVCRHISVVPRALHCGISAILPPMSLRNAPRAGLRVHLENLLIFSLFITISLFSVT